MPTAANEVDEYIESFPENVQEILRKIREIVLGIVPDDTVERINYGVPGYKVNGKNCVFFAGFKAHVSVYPLINASQDLETAVKPFRSGKATVKFPLNQPIPYELITQIVKYLVDQRLAAGGK